MRKIDFYGQVILLASLIVMALAYFVTKSAILFSLIGLFFLGIWQIISALTVTLSHHLKMYNKHIRNYWKACISTLLIFTGAFLVAKLDNNTFINLFIGTAIAGGFITAFYYLYIYKKYFLLPANNETSSTITNDGSLLTELEIVD